MVNSSAARAITGCLLGTAVGDALGLPFEGLSPQRGRRLFWDAGSHHFVLGHGMLSDDTEHACLVANALIEPAGGEQVFERQLAGGLRRWLLTLPAAAGVATLKATIRLCFGVGPRRSGVYSAGNGPAMRSALIGVCYGQDPMRLRNLVRLSTRITHTDPKAEYAALAVAVAAHLSAHGEPTPAAFCSAVRDAVGDAGDGFLRTLSAIAESVNNRVRASDFAARISPRRGPSGYCMESVPVALHSWLCHPTDFRAAVVDAIECGGDTDTMAAIAGAIVGARVGSNGIPRQWMEGLCDWPRTRRWIEAQAKMLGDVVDTGQRSQAAGLPYLPLLLRNITFASIAIAHGFRRLLPPY